MLFQNLINDLINCCKDVLIANSIMIYFLWGIDFNHFVLFSMIVLLKTSITF